LTLIGTPSLLSGPPNNPEAMPLADMMHTLFLGLCKATHQQYRPPGAATPLATMLSASRPDFDKYITALVPYPDH
jgi:hypothetical protein